MGIRDHRDRAKGKPYKSRMPKPSEAKLGTRIHDYSDHDEEVPEVEKCQGCGCFVETQELLCCEEELAHDYFGLNICHSCREEVNEIVKEFERIAHNEISEALTNENNNKSN